MTKDASKSPPTLEDTQRVNVLSEDNDQVFSQAIDNLKKENFPFAYKCLDRLIENNHKLEQLSDELGIIADGFPSEIDLSLYLVKIYNLLGHKEKALKTLQRAQKNINFE